MAYLGWPLPGSNPLTNQPDEPPRAFRAGDRVAVAVDGVAPSETTVTLGVTVDTARCSFGCDLFGPTPGCPFNCAGTMTHEPAPLPAIDLAAVNPGVRCLVAALRADSFNTTDSGDGATHDHPCDRPYPYVAIRVDPPAMHAETVRLVAWLRARGIALVSVTEALASEVPSGPCVHLAYDPVDGVATIDVIGVVDRMFA